RLLSLHLADHDSTTAFVQRSWSCHKSRAIQLVTACEDASCELSANRGNHKLRARARHRPSPPASLRTQHHLPQISGLPPPQYPNKLPAANDLRAMRIGPRRRPFQSLALFLQRTVPQLSQAGYCNYRFRLCRPELSLCENRWCSTSISNGNYGSPQTPERADRGAAGCFAWLRFLIGTIEATRLELSRFHRCQPSQL